MRPEIELFWLRLVHTIIFAASLACLAILSFYAVTGAGRILAFAAMVLPITVFITQLFNGMECIMQTRAQMLAGVTDEWVRDVFFVPKACALWIVRVLFIPYALAIGGSLIRLLIL